jgi:hypothetical protein
VFYVTLVPTKLANYHGTMAQTTRGGDTEDYNITYLVKNDSVGKNLYENITANGNPH